MKRHPHGVKRGDLVEFTDHHYRNYPPKDISVIQYGVALDNEADEGTVEVKLADGTTKFANFVHSYAWAGWIPDGLEPIWEEINQFDEPEAE